MEGVTLAGDTLVFLKTNFRKVFFLVSENAESISVLEALNYFKANKEEQAVPRIENHHKHVEMALQKFRAMRDLEAQKQDAPAESGRSLGRQTATSLMLLTNFMREIDEEDLHLKVAQLKKLVERGVITNVSQRLQNIHDSLKKTGKTRMTHDQALSEIIEMAKKYARYYVAEEALLDEQETEAEIILSETFQE